MPEAPLLVINGSGHVEAGHYGIDKPFDLVGLNHRGFHRDEMPQERIDQGETVFQSVATSSSFFWARLTFGKGDGIWMRRCVSGPLRESATRC